MSQSAARGAAASGNWGAPGQCVWYVLDMVHQQTGVYPAGNGDAWNFANSTGAAGWTVSSTPRARSVAVFQPGQNGAGAGTGHVAWVEDVQGQSVTLSEMNFEGPYRISRRTIVPDPGVRFVYLP